jgi:hypothetical protein
MNIPIAFAISLAAQLIAIHTVVPKLLLINFLLAYAISFMIGMFLPAVPWGLAFAKGCKAQPETLKFGLLVNVVVNFVYVLINALILTFFNVVLLNHAPIVAYFIALVSTFIPLYIVGYIVSFLWNRPAEKIARNICGE